LQQMLRKCTQLFGVQLVEVGDQSYAADLARSA
jgi:hypothetical protein